MPLSYYYAFAKDMGLYGLMLGYAIGVYLLCAWYFYTIQFKSFAAYDELLAKFKKEQGSQQYFSASSDYYTCHSRM